MYVSFLLETSDKFSKGLVQRVFEKSVIRVFGFHAFEYQKLLLVPSDSSYYTDWAPSASHFSFLRVMSHPLCAGSTSTLYNGQFSGPLCIKINPNYP